LLETMHAAAAGDDTDALRRAAHRLKSSSALLAAANFSRMCDELEDRAGDGIPTDWSAELSLLEAEYARVKAALETLRDTHAGK
jgi:HPt (histidine-containing phosphotransfer) domain-containing protein